MKQKFDLETWFKDKSRKVVTVEGKPVRIICTDAKSLNGYSVCGLLEIDGQEKAYFWQPNGEWFNGVFSRYNLYFADDEPVLTEFEEYLLGIIERARAATLDVKIEADELLTIARKQFEKDLPKWKKAPLETGAFPSLFLVKASGSWKLVNNGYTINLADLEKLPKED